ncbi:Hypothetical predicted protein, partial [Paramuricea clavata]
MEIGPIWDMIANDIVRHERFREIPANVQELYANVGNQTKKTKRVNTAACRAPVDETIPRSRLSSTKTNAHNFLIRCRNLFPGNVNQRSRGLEFVQSELL